MNVIPVDQNSPYLQQVITLADANSSTLGFLPDAVFIDAAQHRRLLVATDNEGTVLGYLLYRISGKKMLAYIVHLCVHSDHRNKKVATSLVQELKTQTNDNLHGISVRCRRDYDANRVWPSFGFSALGEIRGRGKKDTTLTVWRFDYGHPTLFTLIDDIEASSKIKVSMDANVFYKLKEPPSLENKECQALLADWLTEATEMCITEELFNEINRHPDKGVRTANRAFARKFPLLAGSKQQFDESSGVLHSLFSGRLSVSDKSDIRQLAKSVAAGVQFFVTLDPRLLTKSDEIFQLIGVRVLRPADLILEQDSLIREAKYQPVRFAGVSITIERGRRMEQPFLNESFRASQEEKKQQFETLLNSLLADPHHVEVTIVKDPDRPYALLSLNRSKEIELEVALLRIDRRLGSGLASTLTRYIIQDLILTSAKESRAITRITDQYLAADSVDALKENGFYHSNGTWIKVNLVGVASTEDLRAKLSLLRREAPWAGKHILDITRTVESALASKYASALLSVEKALWPVKIVNVSIPTFIVPIWPEWAMHLFDPDIGSQDLFGSNPNVIFRVENAYYRNNTPPVLSAPARILWYVSKHGGNYQGTESIRACSFLEDVLIDRPKPLFSRFRRLGVYSWNDVYKLAKRDLNRKIMGFRFAKTETLRSPIDKRTLQKIWHDQFDKHFHIQSPIKIPQHLFFQMYKMSF